MVRLPIPDEFNRTGGAGVYYHVSIEHPIKIAISKQQEKELEGNFYKPIVIKQSKVELLNNLKIFKRFIHKILYALDFLFT